MEGKIDKYIASGIVLAHLMGVVAYSIPTIAWMVPAGTVVTLLFLALILSFRSWIWFLSVAVVGWLIEVVGVHSGVLFGSYTYGDTLGLKVFDVPLIMGPAWVVAITSSFCIADSFVSDRRSRLFLAMILIVLFDIALEPAADILNYWHFQGGIAPLQNYLAWGIFGLIGAIAADRWFIINSLALPRLASVCYLSQICFFLLVTQS